MTATVRVSGLRGFSGLVEELGGDAGQLSRDCGIDPELLGDDDALVPYRRVVHLMEHSATELATPDFGLRLAATQDIGVLGPLAVAIQNSSTVEGAVRCAAAHLFVQSPALKLEVEEQPDLVGLTLQISLANMPHNAMQQAEDLAMGLLHRILSMLLGGNYKPVKIELRHKPACLPSRYLKYFGASVLFESTVNAVWVSEATMAIVLEKRSSELHQLAIAFLGVQVPTPDGRLATRVDTAIRRTLGTQSCNRTSIARAMAIHPRTLQRRLEREGETFDGIRDRIRKEKAVYYLQKTDAPLSQVAGIVGYSEQSVFTRSCQRWFGMSPSLFRASLNS